MLLRAILANWLMVFIPSLRELSCAIFLFTPATAVMSTLIFDLSDAGNFEQVSTLAAKARSRIPDAIPRPEIAGLRRAVGCAHRERATAHIVAVNNVRCTTGEKRAGERRTFSVIASGFACCGSRRHETMASAARDALQIFRIHRAAVTGRGASIQPGIR